MWNFITDFTIAAKSKIQEKDDKIAQLEGHVKTRDESISTLQSTVSSQQASIEGWERMSEGYGTAMADYDRVVTRCSQMEQDKVAAEAALREFAAEGGFPLPGPVVGRVRSH